MNTSPILSTEDYFAENFFSEFININNEPLISNEALYLTEIIEPKLRPIDLTEIIELEPESIEEMEDQGVDKDISYPIALEMVFTNWNELDGLIPEMCNEIKMLASSGVHAEAIIEVLQKKNSGKYIHAHNVYNVIQMSHDHDNTVTLCFTHCAFNAGVQSTQRFESYNAIIKKQANGLSSLLELVYNVERLLDKESYFVRFNEIIDQLPINREE
ncbi:11565_t:CDS:2, partial [Racocetra fulgida]